MVTLDSRSAIDAEDLSLDDRSILSSRSMAQVRTEELGKKSSRG